LWRVVAATTTTSEGVTRVLELLGPSLGSCVGLCLNLLDVALLLELGDELLNDLDLQVM
jgi:hypothetical protein